ncbi:tetratricopeptide TPR_4-containing protein [Salinisphaera sp. PC39]|uniref:tetratricopeptide repeat protein n=1 Tax=Salinisphaera sp. PC39 TaxID=1304156 RepID=UPI00333E3B50
MPGSFASPGPLAWIAGLCLLASGASADQGSADAAYRAGIAAARDSDYVRALRHFRDARDHGKNSATLYFNIGVARYRLGRYPAAREAFLTSSESAPLRAISLYNLGLVARTEGRSAAARARFREAYDTARTDKLRDLAAAALDGLPRRHSFYIEGFAGYDSNPRLAGNEGDEVLQAGREGDAVAGVFAAGQYLLAGDWDDGLRLRGHAYNESHPDLDSEDITSLRAGLGVYRTHGWRYRVEAGHIRLGDDTLQDSVGVRVARRYRLGDGRRLALALEGERIAGGDRYAYLDGWRVSPRAGLRGDAGPWSWSLRYRLEYNDRDDLSEGGDFFSVSPWRHEIGAGVRRPLGGGFAGRAGVAYRVSLYTDPEIREDAVLDEREDDRVEFRLGLSRPLTERWTARLEATHWDNDSNFDRYDYERTDVRLSLGASF